MPHRPMHTPTIGPNRRAFTLIELLIVIAIIAVLVAVSMAVGTRVLGAGKSRTTEDVIRVLDASVVAYEQDAGEMPPAKYSYIPVSATPNNFFEYPIFDGRPATAGTDLDADPPIQSVARYTAMARAVPGANAVLQGLNAKFIRNAALTAPGTAANPPGTGIEVLDGWGRPIRMVHPAYDGGYGAYFTASLQSGRPNLTISERRGSGSTNFDYRRSFRTFNPATATAGTVGDADEGICPNRRPYFYSAGPDGDPGKREDNVYTTRPTFTQETSQYK